VSMQSESLSKNQLEENTHEHEHADQTDPVYAFNVFDSHHPMSVF